METIRRIEFESIELASIATLLTCTLLAAAMYLQYVNPWF